MTEDQQFAETTLDRASRPPRPLRVGINLPTVEGTMAGKTPNTLAGLEWFAAVLDLLDHGEA